ncbi:hypothetical protein F2Q69_00020679 [Brassica cretica]|uniref:Uncharacterized protein n=1 Tax=Brassica cretica TaxID=69181 RepID=A0A8S9QPK8_BRACR|nr:hypothetical protein F2Q69_00020679 [Brassica cretica]
MDIQIAQTTETIKRQQGTLPGKIDKNPKDCNAVELRSGRHLSDPVPKKLTAQEKGKQKEGEPPSLEDVHDDDHELEQPTTAVPVAPTSVTPPNHPKQRSTHRPTIKQEHDRWTTHTKGTTDAAAETKTSEEDQQEVSYVKGQGWQFKNYHPNPNVRNNPHLFSYKTNPDNLNDRSQGNQFQNTGYQKPYFQNQNGKIFILRQAQNQFQNRQNNPHAAPATASRPDELKGMMQQLL